MSRRKFDFYLLIPVFFLLGFSIAIIASVSPENLTSHFFYIVIAFVFFLLFSFLDSEILLPFSPLIYVFCLVFLVLPFFLGTVTRGSVRWIPIGGYTIQPSELVKPFLVLISAWFWSKREFSFQRLLQFALLFLPPLVLIFLQPDLGSTLVVLSIFAGAILTSGIKIKQLLVLMLIGILLIPLFWFSLHDYQKMRVVHFINPYSDPLGQGYNVIQAKIAVGSGGLFGRGLGRGTQSHLSFLPERHTDFVFASLSEELGFAGAVVLLFLYLLLFLKILKIASGSKQRVFCLVSLGMFFYLFFQTAVNIAMNIGLMPITGITLPLVSYGGSSLLTTLISLGMLESICRQGGETGLVEIK